MDFPEVVREVVDEARRKLGSGPALALELQRVGVAPESGRYSESAISNWSKGRAMPPSDVLLAAAYLSGISIDARLAKGISAGADSDAPAGNDLELLRAEIRDLQQKQGHLHALLIDLYARTGQPFPHNIQSESTRAERAVGE